MKYEAMWYRGKQGAIIQRLINEILELREHIRKCDPAEYRRLIAADKKYCESVARDIKMRVDRRSKP